MIKKERIPIGQLKGSFEELFEAGCIQTGADVVDTFEEAQRLRNLYVHLQTATQGNPCNGCPEFKSGTCSAYKKYHSESINKRVKATTTVSKGKTVAQLAKEHGISKNEVRRRKHRGDL
ncbi:MAG: hypothetical protein ACXAEN_24765 [Candidatus Thorarchaeota archaeon]|jgi:hypothetical protein